MKPSNPILEKEHDGELVIEIFGQSRNLGTSPIRGWNTPYVGYHLACSLCDWTQKVNGPLSEARPIGREHARLTHGIRGLKNVAQW